ncbi:M42 family peptidase, partial [Candidatus Roizmanbacteria bacterium]|nr:M42 family peptidase [Candidatus Roizmanbacteria bacterium]
DKLGIYVLIQLVQTIAQNPNPYVSLYAVTTTQEEIGSRGAVPAVNHIGPKYSIIIDTIRATDTPIANKEEIGKVGLGAGPVITKGSNTNPDLFFILKEIAKRENIPFQVEADAGPTATDADPIQISGTGTATIVVGIPIRYTHFPLEVFCWDDVTNSVKLLTFFLKSLRESAEKA